MILVAMANEGEINIDVEVVKTWVPKDINYFGEVVFFKHDKTYFSMKRDVFKKVFNL